MSWPLSHDFNEAIQTPQIAFTDPDLKAGEAVVGATGLPLPRSGNFADVYQLRGADGREWAVKCFTRPVAGLGERYAKVSDALAKANLPFSIGFAFLAEGIRVGGAWRPVVKMEWVEGLLLNQVARENAGKPAILNALAQMWAKLCKRLREAGVAHADIQHGNVLLVPGSRPGAYGLKLIDYDGMWVQALANTPSGESGHSSYQHPARAATRTYSPDVDRFPHLAIATALRGLAVGGSALWEKYDNGDNLLFTEADYKKPADSKLMRELWETGDPAVQSLVGRLAIACGKPIPQTPWLDQLAPEGEPAALDDATRREAAAALGIVLPVPVPVPPPPAPAFEVIPTPELVPAPVPWLAPLPAPLPAPPAPAPAPLTPFVVEDAPEENEVDVELVEPESPRRKKYRPKEREEKVSGSNTRLWFFVGGGVLLLVGGIIAGVVIGGGKPKTQETAQEKTDPPKEPTPPKPPANGLKPKDKDKVPGSNSNPKDTVPPVPPDRPEPKSGMVENKPPDPPVPGDPLALKLRWSAPTGNMANLNLLYVGDTSNLVIASSYQGRGTAFDLKTGEVRPGFERLARLDSALFFPLLGQQVAVVNGKTNEIHMWDERTGRDGGPLLTPPVPESPGAFLRVYPAPNARFIAAGRMKFPPDGVERPIQVYDAAGKKAVVSTEWVGGSVHFTADSSRVLIVETTGRGRWYNLATGKLDREWKLDGDTFGGRDHGVTSLSDDGSVLGYNGPAGHPRASRGPSVLDGATGKVIHLFPLKEYHYTSPVMVSGDGRRAAVHRSTEGGKSTYDVTDAHTGAVFGRATVESGQSNPSFALARDGSALVILSSLAKKVSVFDLSAGPVAGGPKDPPPSPGEPPALKERWSMPRGDRPPATYLHIGSANLLLVATGKGDTTGFDLKTGRARPGFAGLSKSGFPVFFELDGKRVAVTTTAAEEFRVWDELTGQDSGRLFTPALPGAEDPATRPRLYVSPNGRYVATARYRQAPGPELPLRVYDAETKKAVVSENWVSGSVYFTADSSRVLVAELNGRCRWFKLPSGEPAGGWELTGGSPTIRSHHVVTDISADGSTIGYFGAAGHPKFSSGPAVLDGTTGKPLHVFPKGYLDSSPVLVSADGRWAAVLRAQGNGNSSFDIADARTGAVLGRATVESERMPSFAFARDGTALVVMSDKKIHVFDVGGGVVVGPQPPDPKVPELDVPELKSKWSVEVKAKLDTPTLRFDDDGQSLALVSTEGVLTAAAYNPKTGAFARELSGPSVKGHFHRVFGLDKGKFAIQTDEKDLLLWDPATGKTTPRSFPPPAGAAGIPFVNMSPDQRYLTVGNARPAPGAKNPPVSPLRVIDTTTNKPVLTLDWNVGNTAFTANSSRVLVVDDTDTFRWYTLRPALTVKPESEWSFTRVPDGRNARLLGISATGDVILFHGQPTDKPATVHVLDGKDGTVRFSFPPNRYLDSGGSVSDDGRRVMLLRNDGTGAEILDTLGIRLGGVKLPAGGNAVAAVCWKTRLLVTYDRVSRRLTAYEIPAAPVP